MVKLFLAEHDRPTLERFRELRAGANDALDPEAAKAILRELKAVGGNLRALRVALTGRDSGPELWAVLPRCRGTRRCARTNVERAALRHLHPLARRAAAAARAGAHVLLRADRLRSARTSATHVRSSSGCGCARGCASAGYEATLVHNITDINDKIYDAAPGASAELAERATQLVPRGHGRPRARDARPPAEGDRVRPADRRVHRGAGRARARVRGRGRRLLPRRALPASTGGSPGSAPTRSRSRSRTRSRRTRATSRSGRRTSRARTPWWDSPWGRGRPGWHIECSAMAEELLGPAFEIHGGGLDLVFPHHENELAQSRALGHAFAQIWAHNGMLRFTGEKMSKSVGNIVDAPRGDRRVGPRDAARLLPDRPLAQADRLLDGDAGRRRPRRRRRCGTSSAARPSPAADWDAFVDRARRRLQHARGARAPARLARPASCCGAGSGSSGSARSPSATRRRPRSCELAERRARGAGRARLRARPTGSAPRSRPRAGRCATSRGGFTLVRSRVTPDLVYGRRPCARRCAAPREVLEVWATERARQPARRGWPRRQRAQSSPSAS